MKPERATASKGGLFSGTVLSSQSIMKKQIVLLLAGVVSTASLGLTSSCSTSGGKQQPMIEHAAVSRDLKGSALDVKTRAQSVFKDMGINLTGTQTKNSGGEQDLTGVSGNHTVSVQINDLGQGMSHVEVSAKDGTMQWNEDYARSVLNQLISKS